MTFEPEKKYRITQKRIPLVDFVNPETESLYILQPPYQRKPVWDDQQRQDLMDSLVRCYYIPSIVLREIKIDGVTKWEVIDGQQRIDSVVRFFNDRFPLPRMSDINLRLANKKLFSELPSDIRDYIQNEIAFYADIITQLDDPFKSEHLKFTADIFERLQQGEPLEYAEKLHAKLNSLVRNFLVKYACDYDYNYEIYEIIKPNPNKHPIFTLSRMDDRKLEHLAVMARLLLFEIHDGPTDIYVECIEGLFEDKIRRVGIGNYQFESELVAQELLNNLDLLYEAIKDDVNSKGKNNYLAFQFSLQLMYLLVRHLRKTYVIEDAEFEIIKHYFQYSYVQGMNEDDQKIVYGKTGGRKTQGRERIEERYRVLHRHFFEFVSEVAEETGIELISLEPQRIFSPEERAELYRRCKGVCQICKKKVSEREFHADHVIPYSKGGPTELWNGQVLCPQCNLRKGSSSPN